MKVGQHCTAKRSGGSKANMERVTVPGLTFGNVALSMCSKIHNNMEVKQRGVGRSALGAYGKTPNKAAQGDMGWVSLESREVGRKNVKVYVHEEPEHEVDTENVET